jgi:predicted RND superfamily exporter protein
VLGFLALSGIDLNLVTAILSSIVIGVGIDYAIHFIAAINIARPDGDGYVLRGIDRAGRPIVANALGIAVAMTALWFSPLKVHSQVSMIMWVAMITSALTAIMVIPMFLPRTSVREPAPMPRDIAV